MQVTKINSVCGFLQFLKTVYLENIKKGHPIRIVCGNESADLDSVVSAITYAYFSYIDDQTNVLIPVINISRADLAIRKEIIYVLGGQGISSHDLVFSEDFQRFNRRNKILAVLIDHNDLQGPIKNMVDEVVGIVDHHEDLGIFKDSIAYHNGPRIIEVAGSCSSHVFNYWNKQISKQSLCEKKDALKLCLAAVLADTSNFKYKTERHDLEAAIDYKNALPNYDFTRYYELIHDYKKSIEGLSPIDLLKRDYKEYIFVGSDHSEIRVGMSSIMISLQNFLKISSGFGVNDKHVYTFDLLQTYATKNNLDTIILLTSSCIGDAPERQLAFYISSISMKPLINRIIIRIRNDLQLRELNAINCPDKGYYAFDQLNINASRKQVVPLVRNAI